MTEAADSAHDSQYEDITIQLNLRLKRNLSDEDIATILADKSQEIKDIIHKRRRQSLYGLSTMMGQVQVLLIIL